MSIWHLPNARQASFERRLRWCDLISLSALPGALALLAFPVCAARGPDTINNEFAYCLIVNTLWFPLVVEVTWKMQARLRTTRPRRDSV